MPWWIQTTGETAVEPDHLPGEPMRQGSTGCGSISCPADPPRPWTVTAQASVTDVNRQAWTASTSMLVHPADLYVGIRSPRTFVQGRTAGCQSIVTDLDGKAIAGREIRMRAVVMDWVFEKGSGSRRRPTRRIALVKSAARSGRMSIRD